MEQKKRIGPTVIALSHKMKGMSEKEAQSRGRTARQLIENISRDGKKRTLFIEAVPTQLSNISNVKKPEYEYEGQMREFFKTFGFLENEPFAEAVKVAHAKGHRIVPLDKDAFSFLLNQFKYAYLNTRYAQFFGDKEASPELMEKLGCYIDMNLKEKQWGQKMRLFKPTTDDIIIMHPNHVRGFLRQVDFKPRTIKWVDKPIPNPKKANINWRLNQSEIKVLAERRNIERKKRQEAIRRRKAMLAGKEQK